MSLRIVFAGTPEFAATILDHLLKAGNVPVRVITQPDRPQGRGRKLTPSPVKVLANSAGIEVHQPLSLSPRKPGGQAALATILSNDFDVLVVAAFGLMIPVPLLAHPKFGAINVHASLLPRWRGAAPVEYAIMANDTITGVTLMQMDAGLDTGPVLARRECEITPSVTGLALTAQLANLGGELLRDSLPHLGTLLCLPQDDASATYAPKLRASDATIDWSRSADEIHNQVRALTGRLTGTTTLRMDGESIRLRVLASEVVMEGPAGKTPGTILSGATQDVIPVACGSGTLGLRLIQISIGKGTVLSALEARNGFRQMFEPGRVIGEAAAP